MWQGLHHRISQEEEEKKKGSSKEFAREGKVETY